MTSHKTLRKQALLSAVKAALTPCNHEVLNLHKPGSAIRKVTPGLHTKSVGNTNIRHQILVLWKMTCQGDQRSIISIQRPDSLTRTLRRGCLMDKQHPHHCFLGSPRLTLPPTSQPFIKADPHSHPPAGTSLLTTHGVREPAHPQPRAGHPSWGGSLSNTNTQIHPWKSQKPLGAQVGPGPLGCNTGPCHQNPRPRKGLAFQKYPSQDPGFAQGQGPRQDGGLPQPSPVKCVPLAYHGGSPKYSHS